MTLLGVGTTVTVLSIVGLVIGLVILLVVIALLHGTFSPLRKTLSDVKGALTAPMLERGVQGTDQLTTTRRLADSVPDLALAYLSRLSLAPAAPAPIAPAPVAPRPAAASAPAPAQSPAPAQQGPEPPAWKLYR